MGPRLRTAIVLALWWLVFFTLMRLVFYWNFAGQEDHSSSADILKAFYLGFKFDLRVAAVLVLPFILLSLLPFLKNKTKFWSSTYTALFVLAISCYLLDLGYFAYLNGRVNASALAFLDNIWISAEMVWQTYPVVWGFLGVSLLGSLIYLGLKRWVFIETETLPTFSMPRKVGLGIFATLLLLLGLHGKASQYPLRWSEAFFSGDNFVSSLGLNPIHYFIDTLANRTKDFDRKKVANNYDLVADFFGVTNKDPEKLSFARPIELTHEIKSRPNIVYIVMESMAAYKTGILGHPLNPTPATDQLAKNGWLFSQFYVPSEATARSMFCLLTGVPDVSFAQSSSRNPLIINQNTVANAFTDYNRFYFLGGNANWGNIRGVYKHNVLDLQIYEEGSFKSERTDVWGISDLNLFEEAHDVLNESAKSGKPFIAFIQTAGFHRPYTIPEDRREFEIKTLSDEELKKHGFVSTEEYNSLRFSDFALGKFIELAKKSEYFDNTIFVIHGDHGLPDYKAEHLSEGMKRHILTRFHVPLIFYAPKLLGPPKVISTIATEPDVLPTLAGMTGHKFTISSFGRNLMAIKPNDKIYAFNYVHHQTPPQIGLLDDEFYISAQAGKPLGLFKYKSDAPGKDLRDEYPEKFTEMKNLVFALYETAKYMLYHNPNTVRPHNAAAQR